MFGGINNPHEARVRVFHEEYIYLVPDLQVIHLVVLVLGSAFSLSLIEEVAADVILAQAELGVKKE